MIKLPDAICDSLFHDKFKCGCVFRTLLRCHDGKERPHYFIVLTNSFNIPTHAFLVATSQTDFYDKNPHFNNDILRIPAKQLIFFPKNTIIDCRKIQIFDKDILIQRFRDGILQFMGILPAEIREKLTEIVKKSRFLSLRDRKHILGD